MSFVSFAQDLLIFTLRQKKLAISNNYKELQFHEEFKSNVTKLDVYFRLMMNEQSHML